MSRPLVVFGGPSDEHDISILTGLQVARALGDVDVVYWSKSGDWHLVDAGMEAADFADGVPRKARPLTFEAAPGRGFVFKKSPGSHGGGGRPPRQRDGTLQGLLDLAASRWGRASGIRPRYGQAGGAAMAAVGLPRSRDPGGDAAPFDGPYIVNALRRVIDRHEVADDWDTVKALTRSSPFMAQGAVAELYLKEPTSRSVRASPTPARRSGAGTARSGIYIRPEYLAWGGGERRRRRLNSTGRWRRRSGLVPEGRGRGSVASPDRLPGTGRQVYVNEVNTILTDGRLSRSTRR